jgi:hypothetical protein
LWSSVLSYRAPTTRLLALLGYLRRSRLSALLSLPIRPCLALLARCQARK